MKKIYAVDVDVIDGFNESAKSCFPKEFLCMVRQEDGVVNELVLTPGTVYGDSHSFLQEWMSPVDYALAGTVHSHPGYSNDASDDDLTLFANMGGIHFITCLPYDRHSWRAYNSKGEDITQCIKVIY